MSRVFDTEAQLREHYRKHGFRLDPALATPPPPKPKLPSLQVRYPEEAALQALQHLAEAQHWCAEFSWNPQGRYAGMGCMFLRKTAMVYVQILREGKEVSTDQQVWLDALTETGKVEVYVCPLGKLEPLVNRLMQQEG